MSGSTSSISSDEEEDAFKLFEGSEGGEHPAVVLRREVSRQLSRRSSAASSVAASTPPDTPSSNRSRAWSFRTRQQSEQKVVRDSRKRL